MDAEQFVEAIKIAVRDNSITGLMRMLNKPSGRNPRPELVTASQWYKNLDEEELLIVHTILRQSVNFSLFNLLCVFDGAQVIEDTPDKGEFEIYFVKNGERILLNRPDGPMLHDIYNSA